MTTKVRADQGFEAHTPLLLLPGRASSSGSKAAKLSVGAAGTCARRLLAAKEAGVGDPIQGTPQCVAGGLADHPCTPHQASFRIFFFLRKGAAGRPQCPARRHGSRACTESSLLWVRAAPPASIDEPSQPIGRRTLRRTAVPSLNPPQRDAELSAPPSRGSASLPGPAAPLPQL